MSESKQVDIYVYLPKDKVARHQAVFDTLDDRDKWMTNEIFKNDLDRIRRDLVSSNVLEEDEEPHYIYQGTDEGQNTRIEIPSKNVLNFVIRHDNRS